LRTLCGLLESANHLADVLPSDERYVLMHDGVEEFYELRGPTMEKGVMPAPADSLYDVFQRWFKDLKRHKCNLAGPYPVANAQWVDAMMSRHGELTTDLRFIYDPVKAMQPGTSSLEGD
jgi:hypothetical protein